MSDISKALAPDAPVVVNENGGKQSDTPYGFHMLPVPSMFAAAEVAAYGAKKYGESFGNRNYVKIPAIEHVNHALQHLYGYLAGDKSDDHLAHAIVRCMFAFDVDQKTGRTEEKNETANNAKPSIKNKKDLVHDAWVALRAFHYCKSVDSDEKPNDECWFGFDSASYLLADDLLDYTGVSGSRYDDCLFDYILSSIEEMYKNIDKSDLSFCSLEKTLEAYVDQLAEHAIEFYKEENEDE